jgi:hypothetical protein
MKMKEEFIGNLNAEKEAAEKKLASTKVGTEQNSV